MNVNKLTLSQKNLIQRYLAWCYKTTKEEFDKIERYFTQNFVDEYILEQLKQGDNDSVYQQKVNEFEEYMKVKLNKAEKKKFTDSGQNQHHPDYIYLDNRLKAIEESIKFFLGEDQLKSIILQYENEMVRQSLNAILN